MHLSRRAFATISGLILALSLAVGPVSAQPVQQQFSICPFLIALQNHLFSFSSLQPSLGVTQLSSGNSIEEAFAVLLAQLGCANGTPV
jgi:hypothetical protein